MIKDRKFASNITDTGVLSRKLMMAVFFLVFFFGGGGWVGRWGGGGVCLIHPEVTVQLLGRKNRLVCLEHRPAVGRKQ